MSLQLSNATAAGRMPEPITRTVHGRPLVRPINTRSHPLTERDRVRRVAIICCHCLRNIALYRAGWKRDRECARVERPFWVSANGSCLDVAIMEWCKLFTERPTTRSGRHHWRTVVTKQSEFMTGLCVRLGVSEAGFEQYAKTVVRYRNKFVAHLDNERTAYIPFMWVARSSAAFLYDHLRDDPAFAKYLPDLAPSAAAYYATTYRGAWYEYWRANKSDDSIRQNSR
jgi:hypothetical protein